MSTLAQDTALIGSAADILARINDPDCSLSIWEREAPESGKAVLSSLSRNVRFTAPLADLQSELASELHEAGVPEGSARGAFVADVAHLADRFCAALTLDAVELRLEVVTTNSCRKFHADYVSARLITTYAGTGTQWLEEADASRLKQGEEPLTIRELDAGDVGVFKGKLASEHPAIHRSPPIAGTGEKRLLLVLNPPEGKL